MALQRKGKQSSIMGQPNDTKSHGENTNDDETVTMEPMLPRKQSETRLPRKQSVVWVAMKSIKTKLSLTEEGATPVNWKVIFLVFVSLFSSSFTLTIIFPFLPEMIKGFGYKEEEKGYYAGIIASAMFAGRAFGSYFWGWLSDKKGRRPIMLVTILLNGIVTLAFGFTTNFVYAFATRFLTGLVNGTVIISKTVLYEISDNTNQAVGMSIISVAWGTGIVAGPTIGGYLASPCRRYPDTFPSEGLFYNFPYLIPGAVSFLICLFAFVMDLILLPETLNIKDEDVEIKVDSSEDVLESSDHDKHLLNNPPSVLESRSYLSDGKAAISMEDLHLESDSATYLAQTGKEIHLTRHGIEFTDIKDKDNSAFMDRTETENIRVNKTKLSSKNQDDFHLETEDNSSRKCIDSSHHDSVAYGCHDNISGMDNNKHYINHDSCHGNDLDDYEVSRNSTTKGNDDCTYTNTVLNLKPVSAESEKFLKPKEDNLQDKNMEEQEVTSVSGKTSRICIVCHMIKNLSVIKLLSQYDVFVVTALYSMFSFGVIGFEEIFTVWCATEVQYDGLGYEPNEIGAVLGSSSIPLLLLQFILFPNLVRRFGAKKTFLACGILVVISVSIMPTLHLLREPSSLWVLVVADNMVMKLMTSSIFSAASLFINNSVTPDLAGSVNGLAMTATAITRSIAPIMGGAVFSWTVSYSSVNIGPPFDVSFTFFLFGFILWLLTVWGITIPERLNRQKK